MDDCGEKDYKELLEQYPKVTRVYLSLDKQSQVVIQDITHRMGVGMAEFIEKEVITVDDFDLYCHYVAGAQFSVLLQAAMCLVMFQITWWAGTDLFMLG